MPSASGFVCPKCKANEHQKVKGKPQDRVLELECSTCGQSFFAERGVNGAWMKGQKGDNIEELWDE